MIVQLRYVSGKLKSLILYLLCSIALKLSIYSSSDADTIKSSSVAAVIVNDPSFLKL